MGKKIKVGIIGTGNIGMDLLYKIQKSDVLECGIFAGRDPESKGLLVAEKMGIKTTFNSIRAIEDNPELCDIVFDATSAKGHLFNAPILKKMEKYALDLTPSKIGKMCIPAINLDDCMNTDNVNMITCGGQASIPIAKVIMEVYPETEYIEVVASISSKSAGPGTRINIDEYTQTTKEAIEFFSGAPKAKAIIILNPAEPPIFMHNTIYAKVNNIDVEKIKEKLKETENKIKEYVPGYKITIGPIYENSRLTIMVEVTGSGDYLPKYAGNLDIITCAAVQVAEAYALIKIKSHE